VFLPRIEDLAEALRGLLRADDVVLAMGAGNVSAVAHDLPKHFGGGAA
jgi:UDP-N-acetylmuramate-alanine ligase